MEGKLKWFKGMESPNKLGRPKSSKSDHLQRLKRWSARRGTEKELDRIYNSLQTEKDKLEMHKAVWYYIYAKPAADSISPEELETLHSRLVDLMEENRYLKTELDAIRKTG